MQPADLTTPPRAFPEPKALIELLKPITWFPPMWAFVCGAVSSGQSLGENPALVVAGVILAGPLVCGGSQIVNDWFDRHVDAINEPNRPIPSGRVPGEWGLYYAIAWSILALGFSALLGTWVFGATLVGLFLAWAYSAPPLRLKLNGWYGNLAVGVSYEGLAWITGAAVMLGGVMPSPQILMLAGLYSLGAHGIMTLNDFKSIEGDRRIGIKSLPASLGADRAARLACVVMAVPQVVVIALLFQWGHVVAAAGIACSLVSQGLAMIKMLKDPLGLAPWYNGTGVTLYVLGMMLSAFALRGTVSWL
ncbi:chlorophyll synthase ChlG [Congregibacter litoralis]|uniref:Chlorophyll synthase n=1 Tax=Congregibacter litoralis KT71 TaxID=314285 RepID=A4ACN9_9GAMM|nr:chlorophyll synthase ChlG [Congregibacter litoralis]EAQ96253.1 chlorophyll synthase [Congregibacter litoralis KT71]